MPYIAHIGIVLGENYTSYVKDQWELILQCDGLRYHRRVNSDNLYEIACELFYDKESALLAAKNIYPSTTSKTTCTINDDGPEYVLCRFPP